MHATPSGRVSVAGLPGGRENSMTYAAVICRAMPERNIVLPVIRNVGALRTLLRKIHSPRHGKLNTWIRRLGGIFRKHISVYFLYNYFLLRSLDMPPRWMHIKFEQNRTEYELYRSTGRTVDIHQSKLDHFRPASVAT
jgi:hypothetical protein